MTKKCKIAYTMVSRDLADKVGVVKECESDISCEHGKQVIVTNLDKAEGLRGRIYNIK